jgi:class 3 adenylate cyclase/tetratricopeptide (TPR) repeat protein/ribosomal protein L40E
MKCSKCHHENPEDAKFCNKCGNKLELACLKCGKVNPSGSKFCNGCGHDLRIPEHTVSIDLNQPQSYTPRHLADKILTTRSSIEGERKLVTVFFADVTNYTSISERLDPEEVHQIMDGTFKILMDEIHKYEGTINQFTGDGVMALFGAPVAHEDHAQRACYAALSIQKAMREYGDKIERDTGVEFKMRVGLNSGPVIVGAIGDDLRMDYTAVGDTTNLGSRMEGLARPGAVLVSGHTHRLVSDFFEFESLGKMEVKGKKEPQEAFELIKAGEVGTRIGASIAKGLTRFVGRKKSMAALLDAFEKVTSGTGQVVGVVGEAGVGKSRLLLEMRNLLPQGEYTYFEGRCLQYGNSMPYLPLLGILRSYLDITEGDREFLVKKKMAKKILGLDEKLEPIIPFLQDLLSLKVNDEGFIKLAPKEKRERTFEAIRDLFVRCGQERPLILTFEDIHWIDKTSEGFLDYMIGWLPNTPVMLLLLYRPEYTHPWGSKSYYTKVGLDLLGTNSSSELVKAILEEEEVAPELRQLMLDRAAGNPLFMEEFTHTLMENGSIEKKDKKYVLRGKASDMQVPDTIQGIIAARLDRLEDDLKRIMQVASVIGRDFAFRILQAITGMREKLKSYLLNLQGLELIYEKNLFPELEYIFKHALTQEVAYNSLLLKRRKEIHEKIGRAIEELYAERLEEFYEMMAYHYSRSDSLEKGIHYSRLSGEKAEANCSHSEACDFYKDAIGLLNKLPDTEENQKKKLEVLGLMGKPWSLLGFPESSLGMFQEGERLSKELGDERSLAIIYNAMGMYYSHRGNPQMGIKYSEDAFKAARKNHDFGLMVHLAFGLCISYLPQGDYKKIVNMAPVVIDMIEKAGIKTNFSLAVTPYTTLCSYCGQGMGYLGALDEGKKFLEKGLRNASKGSNLIELGFVETQYGHFYLAKGDWKLAKEHFEKGINYSQEAGFAIVSALSWSALGYVCAMLGYPEAGKKHTEKGLKIHLESGVEMFLSLSHCQLGWICLELDNLNHARSLAEEALRLSQKNNEKYIEVWSLLLLGTTLGEIKPLQIDKAEGCILKGIELGKEMGMKTLYSLGYLYLGQLYLNAGEKEKAMDNLKHSEAMFSEMGMDYWLGKSQEAQDTLE